MAPLTRNGTSRSTNLMPVQHQLRDGAWDFGGSETRSEGSRAASEEPGSYDGDEDEYRNYNSTLMFHTPMPQITETHDDILHPLREAANRVGREVERFAEVLDEYNPLKAVDSSESYGLAFDMIELFHNSALETADKLRDDQNSIRKSQNGTKRRNNTKAFRNQDLDEEMEDAEGEYGALILQSDATTMKDLKRWEDEAQTWDLLRRILELQAPSPEPVKHNPEPINKYSSERQIFDNFLIADSTALEREMILSWLKDTAQDSGEDIDVLVQDLQQNAERGDIIAHGWIHTKAAIKNQKRIHTWSNAVDPTAPEVQRVHLNSSKTEPLVTQLDPDAPGRQSRKLEAQDEYFERAVWLGCYELLRRGQSLQDIKEWCKDRTEIWRAVSMSGLSDISIEDSEEAPSYTSTVLWRRMCFALANRAGVDEYEAAVYGILSGDYQSVLPICRSWNDRLFAHYNSLLRTQFESFVVTNESSRAPVSVTNRFGIFDAVQYHGGEQQIAQSIIRDLRTDSSLRIEANEPMKLVQGALIGKNFIDFALQQGIAYCNEVNKKGSSSLMPPINADPVDDDITNYISLEDHDSMRVVAHIFIIFKMLGSTLGDAETEYALENVLVPYCNFLRLAGKEELIPLYAAQLSEKRCYDVLSKTMIDVVDEDARVTLVNNMTDLGLDVAKFVQLQTENLFAEYPESTRDFAAHTSLQILLPQEQGNSSNETVSGRIDPEFLGAAIERPDMLLIRSLEWYMLVEGLWTKTFSTGAQLYKRFYKSMNLPAAKLMSQSMPSNGICLRKTPAILNQELSLRDLELEIEYAEAAVDFDDDEVVQKKLMQKYMLSETRSFRELERLILSLDCIADAGRHIDMYAEAVDSSMKKDVRVGLNAVLSQLRPHMGVILQPKWLKISQKDEPDFEKLREVFLPEIIIAFDHILRQSGGILSRDNYLECINLSTIVAAEDSDLAELFVRNGRMSELVDTFASDSLTLLLATGAGKSKSGASKKLRALGWKRGIWSLGKETEE